MFRFLHDPLWEPQILQIWIDMIDGEGYHSDRPIVIDDPDPVLLLSFIRDYRHQDYIHEPFFFVRFENETYGRLGWNYMTRHFPKLVFDYFEQSPQPTELSWEDWNIIDTVSWVMDPTTLKPTQRRFIDQGKVRFALVENPFGLCYWVPWYMVIHTFPRFILDFYRTNGFDFSLRFDE